MKKHCLKSPSNRFVTVAILLGSLISANVLFAQTNAAPAGDPAAVNQVPTGKTEEDLVRERSIAEFTRKMKEANYPALFEQAAKEFNVPVDILQGVS
ncbi:MAG: hypothetical protein JWQ71_2392, partial [Pedosphaera sp.]|nr:hypothetical protein [Pedosphaera sp.]